MVYVSFAYSFGAKTKEDNDVVFNLPLKNDKAIP
jgi:hypothetical protein